MFNIKCGVIIISYTALCTINTICQAQQQTGNCLCCFACFGDFAFLKKKQQKDWQRTTGSCFATVPFVLGDSSQVSTANVPEEYFSTQFLFFFLHHFWQQQVPTHIYIYLMILALKLKTYNLKSFSLWSVLVLQGPLILRGSLIAQI